MDTGNCTLRTAFEQVLVPPILAQQLGLMVTELVTNAKRHAFPAGQPGTVRVTGVHLAEGYQLCIEDDGNGMPPGLDFRLRPSGLGLRMVTMLADQMKARLTVGRKSGTCFKLLLPALPYETTEFHCI